MTISGARVALEQNFDVLEASDPLELQTWLDVWAGTESRDVQAHPSYVQLFTDVNDRAVCAVSRGAQGTVLLPLIVREIPGTSALGSSALQDVTSPYGYGGPFLSGEVGASMLASFWSNLERWEGEAGVVSEFIRFDIGRESYNYSGTTTLNQNNIVRDLTLPISDLMMDLEHKVRKNVKKAERSGVEIVVDERGEGFDDFLRIYNSTLDRRSARGSYYFGREFFESIHEGLRGSFVYFHAVHEGTVISTELVLLSTRRMFSFLGGTDPAAFALRPNDLLKFKAMEWGAANGRQEFVLGGGVAADDGIYRYKKSFAPRGVFPFHIGTRVLQKEQYEVLCSLRGEDSAEAGGYFPAYRRVDQ